MSTVKATVHVARGIPATLVHASVGAVAIILSVIFVPVTFWLVIALALGVAAAAAPRLYTAWPLIVLLALLHLAREPSAADWRPYALLAGLHLLHVLASLALVVPFRGPLDARALVRTLRRFALVQLPCQVLLALVLVVFSTTTVTFSVPWIAPVGAVALIGLTAALIVPLARRNSTNGQLSRR